MKKKPGSPQEGFKSIAMWQWGLLLIVAGVVAYQVTGFVLPAAGNLAEARGQALGRGLVSVLCVIAGVVLVVKHFVRGNRH